MGLVTQKDSANQIIDGMSINKSGLTNKKNNRKLQENVQINHSISESMKQATKRVNPGDIKKLVDQIEQSASTNKLFDTQTNRTAQTKPGVNKRNNIATQYMTDTMVTKNYSGVMPNKDNKIDLYNPFDLGNKSKDNKLHVGKQGGLRSVSADQNENEQDLTVHDFSTYTRAINDDRYKNAGRLSSDVFEDAGDTDNADDGFGGGFGDEYTTNR